VRSTSLVSTPGGHSRGGCGRITGGAGRSVVYDFGAGKDTFSWSSLDCLKQLGRWVSFGNAVPGERSGLSTSASCSQKARSTYRPDAGDVIRPTGLTWRPDGPRVFEGDPGRAN